MTLGRLVLETARGNVNERTVSGKELAEIRANMARYWPGPLEFREPQTDSEGPVIYDANGNQVAMLYWPTHPVEETAAAEQATYALGRAMAAAIEPNELKAECGLCAEGMNSFIDPDTGKKMHARNGVVTVCTAQNGNPQA